MSGSNQNKVKSGNSHIKDTASTKKVIREKELQLESFVAQNVVDDIFQLKVTEADAEIAPKEESDRDFFIDPTTNDFKPPKWVQRPDYTAVLDVYKGIDFVECIRTHRKGWYLLGRNPTVCDVLLDHASISRKQAAILYHFSGAAYLVDLGSAHGTFLGKRRLKPFKPKLLKSGRIIKFGASTRYYLFQAFLTPDALNNRELKTNPLIYEGGWEGGEQEKRQLCLNTLLNRRINECLPPLIPNKPSTTHLSKNSETNKSKTGEKKRKKKLRFLKAKEYISGFWDQFEEEDHDGGRFSKLVQTTVIQQVASSSTLKKRPAPGNQISAAEKRRRQMALMSKGVSQVNVVKKSAQENPEKEPKIGNTEKIAENQNIQQNEQK